VWSLGTMPHPSETSPIISALEFGNFSGFSGERREFVERSNKELGVVGGGPTICGPIHTLLLAMRPLAIVPGRADYPAERLARFQDIRCLFPSGSGTQADTW